MPDTKKYISQVVLPGSSDAYFIKDAEAQEAIAKLSNATHFLGVTTTPLTDGATTNPIAIGGESITAKTGDIVIATGDALDGSDEGTEYVFDGEKWYKFGSAKLNELGDLAYKNNATSTFTPNVSGSKNTLAIESYTKASEVLPIVFGSTAVTGATSFKAVDTIGTSVDVVTSGTYSKPDTATVTVNSSATFSGAIPSETAVTGVTGGTGHLNTSAIDLDFISSANDGTQLVYSVGTSAPVTGTITVPSMSVYGVASDASILANATLTASSTASGNVVIASVENETLVISALAFATTPTTVAPYSVGSASAYSLADGNATITVGTSSYKTAIDANKVITSVDDITLTKDSINISVSGSAVTDGSVAFTWSTPEITKQTTQVVPNITTTTIYGTVTTPEWSHAHTINGDIEVHGESTSVTVS